MPHRRDFIKMTGVAAGASVAAAHSQSALAAKRYRWRMVMVIPKTLPVWGSQVQEFAKKVKTMSQNRMNIKVYGAGELVPALSTFDAVKAGQVEMGHSASYYWQGKIPAASFFCSVPFGLDAHGLRAWIHSGGGKELWDEIYKPYGVFSLLAGNTGTQMGGWFNKPIKTTNDFKGLKMRIPGLGGKVVEKLGAKPMLVAGGEIYTNLSTGVIDATEWVGPYHDYTMGFHKAAQYYYYPGWHEPGPALELMINQKAWDTLPDDLQQIIITAAHELDITMSSEWLAKDAEYLEKIRTETKVQISPYPQSVLKKLHEVSQDVKKQVAATSSLAQKIYQSYTEFQKKYDNHHKLTGGHYHSILQNFKS